MYLAGLRKKNLKIPVYAIDTPEMRLNIKMTGAVNFSRKRKKDNMDKDFEEEWESGGGGISGKEACKRFYKAGQIKALEWVERQVMEYFADPDWPVETKIRTELERLKNED
jgi:hypothetical protein